MRICILCSEEQLSGVKEKARNVFSFDVMKVPVSSSGNMPATHWFCFSNMTEELYSKLLSIKENSTMEESSPKEFLEKWNLKIIKK